MSDDEGCFVAREAMAQLKELRIEHNALHRQSDRADEDRVRLGQRVTNLVERADNHETLTHEAIHKMNDALAHMDESLGGLQNTMDELILRPAVPAGREILVSWRATALKDKAKIGAALLGVLTIPGLLREVVGWIFTLLQAHLR